MMVVQKEQDIKHIALLRKVIMDRRSGVALFEGTGWTVTIPFDHGVLLLGDDAPELLGRVLQKPVLRFSWRDTVQQAENMPIPILPRMAFAQVISRLSLPPDRQAVYRQMLSRLPAIKVRFTSVFRLDHEYQELFQEFYRMSLAAGSIQLGEYFAASAGGDDLPKRTNIVLVLYCLGDLLSAPKKEETHGGSGRQPVSAVSTADKANVVSRILMRLRGA